MHPWMDTCSISRIPRLIDCPPDGTRHGPPRKKPGTMHNDATGVDMKPGGCALQTPLTAEHSSLFDLRNKTDKRPPPLRLELNTVRNRWIPYIFHPLPATPSSSSLSHEPSARKDGGWAASGSSTADSVSPLRPATAVRLITTTVGAYWVTQPPTARLFHHMART